MSLSPEVQRDLYRRLAFVALTYSGTYFLAYASSALRWWLEFHSPMPMRHHVVAGLSIVLGLSVLFASRRRRLPLRSFFNIVLAFQVLGAIGIVAGDWGWEQGFDEFQHRIWNALGPPGTYPQDFVSRLQADGLRVVTAVGSVPWVAIWMLIFPCLLPMSPLRMLLAAVCSTAVVVATVLLSLAVHGTPASVQPWVSSLLLDITIPMLICAALTVFVSRVVYKLTRDLSRAHQMGSYQLVEQIGTGGMGEVWRAKHRMLVRPAAVKLIRPQVLGDAARSREVERRFEREAQATAALRSPHTVELYDFGITREGIFYYVMELLDGLDLRSLVDNFGPTPPGRAIFLLRQACHSLEDAHRTGLIHRDIKPANLFACRRGIDYDFVKVLDFGLVKEALSGGMETKDLTLDGMARGTPAFMAPELATGGAKVDGRADIYALGCVAYWLVTGQVVFEAANPVLTLLRHVRDEPVAPSKRTGAPLPAGFESTILACLRKEPGHRPQTAAELGARLDANASEVEPWTQTRAEAWWRDNAATIEARQKREPVPTASVPELVAPAMRSSGGS
jgi:serine/threonine-protein kinase